MFASYCLQISIFKVLQNSFKKELALPEPVRARVTAAASTDLSETLLAGQITEMQWLAKLSFTTIPAMVAVPVHFHADRAIFLLWQLFQMRGS